LPEPILTEETPDAADPEKRVEAQESIKLAFLVLLEQLQPFERAVFLLREVFAYEFAEIASMLEKSKAACRRSFSRAKQHLIDQRPRFQPAPETHRQLLTSFQAAVESGDLTTLMQVLSENVILWTDGGGKTRKALLRPMSGREVVARADSGDSHYGQPGQTHTGLKRSGRGSQVGWCAMRAFCEKALHSFTISRRHRKGRPLWQQREGEGSASFCGPSSAWSLFASSSWQDSSSFPGPSSALLRLPCNFHP
jgi:hypothetical protein